MTRSRIAGAPLEGSCTGAETIDPVAGLFASGARNARGERTRAALVTAATTCFAEYGYSRTRIADIVLGAGVAQGSFYRHFQNKGEILVAVIEPCVRDLLSSSTRTGGRDADERGALVRISTAYFLTYARHRQLMRVTREASSADPTGFAQAWLTIRAEFTNRSVRWLQSLVAAGRVSDDCDVEALATALGAMVDQVAYVEIGVPEAAPRAEQLARLGRVAGDIWFRAVPWTTA